MKKGCVYCAEMHANRCPDAFSEVAQYCGNYNHEDAVEMDCKEWLEQEAEDA